MLFCIRGIVEGRVQGVGFRYFAEDMAFSIGDISGWICNLENGQVSFYAEGCKESLESFVNGLRNGPPFGRVDEILVDWSDLDARKFESFMITEGPR